MRAVTLVLLAFLVSHGAMAAESSGLNVRPSAFDFETTLQRVQAEIEARGATIVATVRHSDAAASVGLELQPTAVVIFGNPRLGTQLMAMDQQIGLDLPLRILVWEAADGEVQVGYREAEALIEPYAIDSEELVNTINNALNGIAGAASG